MSQAVAVGSIYLLPGMSVELMSSVNFKNGNGFYPGYDAPSSMFPDKDSAELELVNGFLLEDTDVGKIAASDKNALSIIYTHMKPAENTIWWFALTQEQSFINIISVPIHDHSSVFQGGPAYGTYFDDDVTEVR